MNKLIIDAANEKIFLMIITNASIYNITHENTKINYEKLTIIINDFLGSNDLKITDINEIYINKGPGSFVIMFIKFVKVNSEFPSHTT